MKNTDSHIEIDSLFWKIALNDDKEAFKKLFTDFFAPLCVYAHRFVEDLSISEDLVQDVFFNLWKNRKSLEIRTSTRNFLVTNVKNSCIDYLRRKEVEAKYTAAQSQHSDSMYDTEDLYIISELEENINKALAKLPDKIRIVFEMNRFHDLTYAEIAQQKEISVKTVEAYMTKALKHLREELKDYLPFITLFL